MKRILSLFILFLIGLSFLSTPKTAAAACIPHPPKIEIVPDNKNRNGAPGEEKQYTIKITNKDEGADCQKVKFTLTKGKLPGNKWTGKFDENTLNIAKQKTESTTFKLKSSTTATEGKKPITLEVKPHSRPKKTFKIFYTVKSSPSPSVSPSPTPTGRPTVTPTPTPSTCRREPKVTITQDKTFVRPGGRTIKYTVAVKNVDVSPCPERNMNLIRELHNENWRSAPWDPDNDINFTVGQTRKRTLAVTSPSQAPVGTYDVKIKLRNNANEVVITKVANFIIANTAPSPTPSPTPRPTGSPSPTPTPTGGPTPTPDPDPEPEPGEIVIDLEIGLDGIGTTSRVPLGGNKNPEEKDRALNFHLYSTIDNSHVFSWQESVTYDETLEKFTALMSLPKPDKTGIADGTYNFYVSGEPFLIKQYAGSINLKSGLTTTIKSDSFNLVTGNITNSGESDNRIDPLDYNVLVACSIYSQNEDRCDENENYRNSSDLNDNGIVDEDDLTLWLKEAANQEGDSPPGEPTPTPSRTPTPTAIPTTACLTKTPLLSVKPPSITKKPGAEASYTVKVKNVDVGPCSKRKLSLKADLPKDNWKAVWDKNIQFEIAKGVEKTFIVKIKSPANATNGRKEIKINLKKNDNSLAASEKVNYVVKNN